MMRKKFWGVLLILAAIALVISRLGLKIQRAARFLAGCRNVVLRGWTD